MKVVILIVVVLLLVWLFAGVMSPATEGMSAIGYGRDDINSHRRVYFHYTTWCKHCRIWKPVWEDVKAATAGSGIEFIEVDEDVAKTPYVLFFPSVYMLSETGTRHQYKGGPNFETLRNWCVSPISE